MSVYRLICINDSTNSDKSKLKTDISEDYLGLLTKYIQQPSQPIPY